MNTFLENIFQTQTFTSGNGKSIKIHSETPKEQCAFLQKIIAENNFKKSIEVGFAYGISTLAIVEQISKNGGNHVAIDKFEINGWDGAGLDLVSQAGYADQLEFFEEYCYLVLPLLLKQKRVFDFAYIDSTKQFDWLLVDFFFLDKLLKTGGIIVFDDVDYPGINKLIKFILTWSTYKIYAANSPLPGNTSKTKKKFITVLSHLWNLSNKKTKNKDLAPDINYRCLALIKTASDTRNWDWHKDF